MVIQMHAYMYLSASGSTSTGSVENVVAAVDVTSFFVAGVGCDSARDMCRHVMCVSVDKSGANEASFKTKFCTQDVTTHITS